jgi:type II secretory pathway component PulM
MCQAHKRKASLKEICAALGVDYPPQRIAVDKQVKDYNRTRAQKAIVVSVELKDGHPVWARRTRKTHPRTDQLILDEFNRDYAGKPLRLHHKSGMYRIAFRLVTHEELMQWLKEKDAK